MEEKSLLQLLKTAQGDRSQNAYAAESGISSASITRILNGQQSPSPQSLAKLAKAAQNNVTYTDLMRAAGYLFFDALDPEDKLLFSSRFKELRQKEKLSQRDVANELGISQKTVSSWECGASAPDRKMFDELADLFGVNVDYLLCLEDNLIDYEDPVLLAEAYGPLLDSLGGNVKQWLAFQETVRHDAELENFVRDNKEVQFFAELNMPESEQNLLRKYRTLDEHGREAVDGLLETEFKRIQALKAAIMEEYAEEPYPDLPVLGYVAAGLPIPEAPTDIYVPRTPDVPAAATHAVIASGDSMEPKIKNGSLIFVDGDTYPETGDIGILSVNGEMVCKKLGKGELLSLNPAYPPIHVREEDDIRPQGKVVF